MQVNIKNLVDDVQCYQTVRELRWPDGVACSACQSNQVIKRGFDATEPARQRYECIDCHTRFDDLTDTIFAGHHQSLKVWILCLYFMGMKSPRSKLRGIKPPNSSGDEASFGESDPQRLNLSNEQIANELDVNRSDVHQMTTQLRQGIVKKSQP